MNRLLLIFSVGILFISCSPNLAKIDNSLKKYFDSAQVQGSIAILNNQMGDITVYNMEADTQRISPGNSFKIAEALIAVESSKLTDTTSKLLIANRAGDSISLRSAFDNNDTAFFVKLSDMIGKDAMNLWIDSLHYGNKKISSDSPYWLNGTLKISPDEQLGLLYKIYFDKLPMQKYAQEVVRELMLKEDNTLYKFSYMTAPATNNKNQPTAWVCGWIEENLHVYFFTCIVNSNDPGKDLEKTGLSIVRKILTSKGFFKGEK